MAEELPPNFKNGLLASVQAGREIEISLVKDGKTLGSYNCAPSEISGLIVVLLTATNLAYIQSGQKLLGKVEGRFARNPVPATNIGLLENPKPHQISLGIQFGEAILVVELDAAAGKTIGQALIAASAGGVGH